MHRLVENQADRRQNCQFKSLRNKLQVSAGHNVSRGQEGRVLTFLHVDFLPPFHTHHFGGIPFGGEKQGKERVSERKTGHFSKKNSTLYVNTPIR